MISAADDAIGRVSDALRQEGLDENTLIFFFSDNGGHIKASQASNAPLRGEKGTVYEGGIRVPFLVKWPRKIPASKTYDQPVISLDVMATALAGAGLEAPAGQPLDGVDLVPFLSGKTEGAPHETLYWRYIKHRAIRHGPWKLTMPSDGPEGLYNLSRDIGESTDLSAEHPEIVKDLKDRWNKWNARMPPVEKLPPRQSG